MADAGAMPHPLAHDREYMPGSNAVVKPVPKVWLHPSLLPHHARSLSAGGGKAVEAAWTLLSKGGWTVLWLHGQVVI